MLHLPHVSARLLDTPLMVHGRKLKAIMSGLAPRLGLRPMAYEDDYDDRPRPQPRAYALTPDGIAIVPAVGLLANRPGGMDATSTPMCSYQEIVAGAEAAVADPNVRALVLDAETPGGEALGCFDATKALVALRGIKPIIAVANAYAFSAGYSIISAADLIYVPESGQVGSVGVVATHVDQSAADAKDGMAWEFIYQGAKKVDGSSHAPLTDGARADVVAEVSYLYDLFVNSVAMNRGISPDAVRATESACLTAPDAIKAGLADRIGTLRDAVATASLRASLQPTRSRSASRITSTKEPGMPTIEEDFAAYKVEAEKNLQAARQGTEQAVAEAVKKATAEAAEITTLCASVGRGQDAAAHIAAGRTKEQVAVALLESRASGQGQAGSSISTAHGVGGSTSTDPADPHGWAASTRRVCGNGKGA